MFIKLVPQDLLGFKIFKFFMTFNISRFQGPHFRFTHDFQDFKISRCKHFKISRFNDLMI